MLSYGGMRSSSCDGNKDIKRINGVLSVLLPLLVQKHLWGVNRCLSMRPSDKLVTCPRYSLPSPAQSCNRLHPLSPQHRNKWRQKLEGREKKIVSEPTWNRDEFLRLGLHPGDFPAELEVIHPGGGGGGGGGSTPSRQNPVLVPKLSDYYNHQEVPTTAFI